MSDHVALMLPLHPSRQVGRLGGCAEGLVSLQVVPGGVRRHREGEAGWSRALVAQVRGRRCGLGQAASYMAHPSQTRGLC